MYIPEHFIQKDEKILSELIDRYNFGVLVSKGESELKATHLPFILEHTAERQLVLVSHMAKANPQWRDFAENEELLVIFQGPHAYISPTLYTSSMNVPTWNYVAVHAYGIGKLLDESEIFPLMEKMIVRHEPGYLAQWHELSEDYKNNLSKGVVAFKIHITRLYGKEKLSQNKAEKERINIIEALSRSSDPVAASLAHFMEERS